MGLGMQLAATQAVAAQLTLADSGGRAPLQSGTSDEPGAAIVGGSLPTFQSVLFALKYFISKCSSTSPLDFGVRVR